MLLLLSSILRLHMLVVRLFFLIGTFTSQTCMYLLLFLFLIFSLKGHILVKNTTRCSSDVVLKENKNKKIFSTLGIRIFQQTFFNLELEFRRLIFPCSWYKLTVVLFPELIILYVLPLLLARNIVCDINYEYLHFHFDGIVVWHIVETETITKRTNCHAHFNIVMVLDRS